MPPRLPFLFAILLAVGYPRGVVCIARAEPDPSYDPGDTNACDHAEQIMIPARFTVAISLTRSFELHFMNHFHPHPHIQFHVCLREFLNSFFRPTSPKIHLMSKMFAKWGKPHTDMV